MTAQATVCPTGGGDASLPGSPGGVRKWWQELRPSRSRPGGCGGRNSTDSSFSASPAWPLLSGLAVVIEPRLFVPILAADLWLLGYHHVVSTFTRLCFDARSFREYRFLILGLPVIVLVAVGGLAVGVGLWTITTIYLYWQWFHYATTELGDLAGLSASSPPGLVTEGPLVSSLLFYLVPVWGILHRSHQAPATFLGVELRVLPVPGPARRRGRGGGGRLASRGGPVDPVRGLASRAASGGPHAVPALTLRGVRLRLSC